MWFGRIDVLIINSNIPHEYEVDISKLVRYPRSYPSTLLIIADDNTDIFIFAILLRVLDFPEFPFVILWWRYWRSSPPVFSVVRVVRSLAFCVMFYISLFVLFFWPLCCLSFFDLRTPITCLVSSNFHYSINGTCGRNSIFTFVLLPLDRYLCWWVISPEGYHSPSS